EAGVVLVEEELVLDILDRAASKGARLGAAVWSVVGGAQHGYPVRQHREWDIDPRRRGGRPGDFAPVGVGGVDPDLHALGSQGVDAALNGRDVGRLIVGP